MSALNKLVKKKVSQDDLRRLMADHKVKLTAPKKIDSPLAKYLDNGQLTCVLCNSIVRSEAVWPVHINAKQHKENVELAKTLKAKTQNFTIPAKTVESMKRSASPTLPHIPEKKLKGILKNSQSKPVVQPIAALPSDFFDSGGKQLSADTDKKLVISEPIKPTPAIIEETERAGSSSKEKKEVEEAIPEGFFDDPVLDAKVRNVEYKDPMEEEWERFQKEMKEESSTSAAIIAGEQEEATAERQIDEIDEQMRNWHRVLDLEKKKEDAKKQKELENIQNMDADNSGDSGEEDFDEYLDWRAKKSFR